MAPRMVPFQNGMQVGFGYDLLNGGALYNPAVQGAISAPTGGHGQTVLSSFLRIDDQKTLHETIGVNVDAGGSYFGVGGDVKVQYAKECNMSEFATHVMVRVSVQDAFENFINPVLTPEANDLLRARHEISVSNISCIWTNCIVPFSVERVGTNIYFFNLFV